MTVRSRLAWLIACCLLVVAIASHVFLIRHRDDWAPGQVADYTLLYYPSEVPRIARVSESNGNLEVTIRGVNRLGKSDEETLRTELQEGRREYTLPPVAVESPAPIVLTVNFAASRKPPNRAWIFSSNVPLLSDSASEPLSHWTSGYWETSAPDVIERARALKRSQARCNSRHDSENAKTHGLHLRLA